MNIQHSIHSRDSSLFNEKEAAKYLNLSVKTLQYWRVAGDGPIFIKLGRLVRYENSALENFIQKNRRNNTCVATSTTIV